MIYYVYAWVSSGTIVSVQSSSYKLSGNPQPQVECDYYISAEASGEYVDSGTLFGILSVKNQTLVGVDFISQTVEEV